MRPSDTPIPLPGALSAGLVNASLLLYTFWLLLPAVQTTGGAAAGVCCVLLFGAGVLLDAPYLKRRGVAFALRALCAACLPLVFWFWLERGGGKFWGYYCQQGMFWFPLLYCAYARTRRDERLWRHLPALLLGCMAVTTLTTMGWLAEGMLRGGRVYAYSRSLGSGEPGREAYLKELMLRNIGGYDFIYASALCLPMTLFAAGRFSGWKRAGLLGFGLAQLGMVIMSQYTYATIFAVGLAAVTGLAALLRALSRRHGKTPMTPGASMGWALLPFVAVVFLRVPLVSLAADLCRRAGLANFAHSLGLLLAALTGGAADTASRLDYYRLPLEGIARSPLLGSLTGGAPMLSKHSDLLDLFSGVGILGAAAVLGMGALMGRGSLAGLGKSPARAHLALQWCGLAACALLGTVLYSRDISLVVCACALLALEEPRKQPGAA